MNCVVNSRFETHMLIVTKYRIGVIDRLTSITQIAIHRMFMMNLRNYTVAEYIYSSKLHCFKMFNSRK